MSNRAERRRQERAMRKGDAVYQVKRADIEALHQRAIDECTLYVLPRCIYASMEVLRTKFGFGAVRMKRFVDAVFNTYDCVDKQHVTLDEVAEAIEREIGVAIRRNDRGGFHAEEGKK
ncbi:MAG: hypothetical protein IJZ69_04365 [Bacteroidales bacterium]|nr:hypothetical protein [Bacteroidales bacterium]MBQ8809548.1 hypothetical protein [Bacteroidales bacterium]